eukprot:1321225-Prymnesium_polylepis.1
MTAANILFRGDRIDAVNDVPVTNARELVGAWRAASGSTIALTIQREEHLQIAVSKPPTSQIAISWASTKAPVVGQVQLSGGAAYPGTDCAVLDTVQSTHLGASFAYEPAMLWPGDLLVAVNGVGAATPKTFDTLFADASGSLTVSIQ